MAWIITCLKQWRAAQHMRRSPYLAQLADLPPALQGAWQRSAPKEYQGIRTDAFFFAHAAEGLLRFFDAQAGSGRPCALPSEAADSVWHAWLRWNRASLDDFCCRHFGATMPHLEHAALASHSLARALVACRQCEGIAPQTPCLPDLFGLDARLRMPYGHGYWRRGDDIVYTRLGRLGAGRIRARAHPELTPAALVAAGLVAGAAAGAATTSA
jgi:hypothetical protein